MQGGERTTDAVASERAESLYAAHLARADAGEEVDLEALCEQHPDLAGELRELDRDRAALVGVRGALLDPLEVPPSFFRAQPTMPGRSGLASHPGQVIGDFRLLEPIGQGGMGQVWRAEQVSLRRAVALKLVRPERVNDRALALFAREARAGGRLSHPGIVSVYGHGETDGIAWIAMELVEGAWTLRDHLDEVARQELLRPDYYEKVAELVALLADALQAAHDAGVIHRDLKPQNVLIARDDRPLLTDFGLARLVDESALSESGEVAGTYYYMSPEQVAGRRTTLDHRTDVFSLGVVLYELLALRRPFEGDTTHQVAEQILKADPPALRNVRSRIPRELSVICAKALEKSRERRYPSMASFAEDLRRFLTHQPIEARPPTRLVRAGMWLRRHPTLSFAGGTFALALVVVSGLLGQVWMTKTVLAETNQALRERNDELADERGRLRSANEQLEVERAKAVASADLAEANAGLARSRAEEAEQSARRADQEREAADRVIAFLVDMFRETDPAVHHGSERTVRELLDRASQLIHDELDEDALTRARLASTMGQAYLALGLPRVAIPLLEEALHARESSLDPADPDTITARHNLATARLEAGEYTVAEDDLRLVLQERERVLGPDHPDTLDTANNLTVVLFQTLRYEEAKPIAERVLSGYRPLAATMPNDLCEALLNAAGVDRALGDNAGARSKLVEALDLATRALTLPHPTHQRILEHMTLTCYTFEDFAEAEAFGQQALEEAETLYGETSGLTQSSLDLLGSLYLRTGRFESAEDVLMRSLEIGQSLYQPGDQAVLNPMNSLAGVYANSGRVHEAEELLQEVLRASQDRYGLRSTYAVSALNNLGSLYVQLDRLDEAEPLLEQAMTLRTELLGEDNPSTWISMSNVALLRMSQGRWEDAGELLSRLLELAPRDHPDYPRYQRALEDVQARD